MRPLSLKGHERALTRVRFNREGDLLFSAAKDKEPCIWYTENGERLGTYEGHGGAVWDIDVTWDTTHMCSAAADNSVKLWDCETGACLSTIQSQTPARSISLSFSGNLIAYTTLKMTKNQSMLQVRDTRDENQMSNANSDPLFTTSFDQESAYTCLFTSLDEKVTVGLEKGQLLQFDLRKNDGPIYENTTTHKTFQITDLQLSPDGAFILSSCRDKTAALLDAVSLEHVKHYKSERPVNSACASPIRDHICLGGGEDAMQVTQTSVSAGHFEAKLYHMVFEEEFARFKGHFGPINSMAWHPSGTSIATGGEDGYVRIQEFDDEYLQFKYDF
ncbi:hypothetical protein WR25_14216 [Diploscapter pachys]|uniref:Eukaryotic translation initiation factor 3 subunit I n=1 Tax=Diploscapter pachys TaxID=2018661 RepID=A0A2A2LMD6_9BILA|nr:hypothetical protein WR25_14216 [Diploscapter pachys]